MRRLSKLWTAIGSATVVCIGTGLGGVGLVDVPTMLVIAIGPQLLFLWLGQWPDFEPTLPPSSRVRPSPRPSNQPRVSVAVRRFPRDLAEHADKRRRAVVPKVQRYRFDRAAFAEQFQGSDHFQPLLPLRQ